ncbi:MAG: hypothetical protein J2P36_31990, partial [Ktedonobacteraceae bacterium]|nr:hypothetical protein [Ktedonobacteraceae bacterium]
MCYTEGEQRLDLSMPIKQSARSQPFARVAFCCADISLQQEREAWPLSPNDYTLPVPSQRRQGSFSRTR